MKHLFLFLCLSSWGQAPETVPQVPAPAASLPYLGEVLPPGLKELDRAKTLMIGAFPFAYLLSGLGYDIAFYVQSDFDPRYTPWPAGSGTDSFTGDQLQEKYKTLIISSLIISGLLAVLDFSLGLMEEAEPLPLPPEDAQD